MPEMPVTITGIRTQEPDAQGNCIITRPLDKADKKIGANVDA
jgi:hypothetical protein